LTGTAEAQVISGVIVKRLLIAYFIGNIYAKKYENLFMCIKVIASQRWDVFFETRCIYKNQKRLSLPCCFLAPCDKRKHTAHTHQQAASQASTDSAWRHPMWLPHGSLGFQRPVLTLTPQTTIEQSTLVACNK